MTIVASLARRITDRAVRRNHDALAQQFRTNTDDTAIYLDDGRAAIVTGSALETAVDGWRRHVRTEVGSALRDILGLLEFIAASVVMSVSMVVGLSLDSRQIVLMILCLLGFCVSSGVMMFTGLFTMQSLFGGSISRAVRCYRATVRPGGDASPEYAQKALFRRLAVVDALAVEALTPERRDALYGAA